MTFPWINMFWRRKPEKKYLTWDFDDVLKADREFMQSLTEYEQILSHFESTLEDKQREVYWDLKNAAQKMNLLKNRIEFLQEVRANQQSK